MSKEYDLFISLGYIIDYNGNVLGKSRKWLKLHVGTNGYLQVNAYHESKQKTFLIHRLIASKYIPNPDKLPEVNHKDGNKLNNHVLNLEWCTRSHNIKHGIETGLISKSMIGRVGRKHWRSIPVLQISVDGKIVNEFESSGDAERKTKFSAKTIQDVCRGKLKTYKGYIWKYKT